MFRSFLSLGVYHLTNYDLLVQRDFEILYFYKNTIFKVSLSVLMKLLIPALFYACNMRSIMEFVMIALRSNMGHRND